jgi:peptidoglycan/LPS O-acetylase OafA/YrhL
MTTEPAGFRNRLLDAQPMTPALREEYRRELEAILNHKLTRNSRLLAYAALLASLVGAFFCAQAVIVHSAKQDTVIVSGTFTAISVALALWLARVLWRGEISRRASFKMVEWLGGAAVSVFLLVTLFRGMHAPSEPASIFSGIMAILFAMAGFAWATGARITAATMETREHLLRIESRLADLAERLHKNN